MRNPLIIINFSGFNNFVFNTNSYNACLQGVPLLSPGSDYPAQYQWQPQLKIKYNKLGLRLSAWDFSEVFSEAEELAENDG